MGKKRDIDVSKEAGLIWKIANDVLRDIFQRTEYTDIIYPMVLIRRLECVLQAERAKVEVKLEKLKEKMPEENYRKIVNEKIDGKIGYSNISIHTLASLKDAGESTIKDDFTAYLDGYQSKRKSDELNQIGEVINSSGIRKRIDKLASKKILFSLIEEFTNIDLMPDVVSNIKMGYIFEELIRRFSEANNSEAGEHYTPREVVDLMVMMLDIDARKYQSGSVISIYDPACGTGGMLTAGKEYIEENLKNEAKVLLYGQEVSDKTWSVCEADLMIKGEKKARIVNGDTLQDDGFPGEKFDFMLSNPPYGKSWSKIKGNVLKNSNGRFDIGQPRSSDGQLLFTLHMLHKMKAPEKGGSSIAIVHNGSPLFSGDAGSGESKIRQYIIENDYLDTIIALPTDLFYNTGIATYIWLVKNNKPADRKGKIQLINAVDMWKPMKRSLGNKRRRITDEQVKEIVQIHQDFQESDISKIYELDDFAYRKVYLNLEERDENDDPVYTTKTISIPQGKIKTWFEVGKKDLKNILDKTSEPTALHILELKKDNELTEKYNSPDEHLSVHKTVTNGKLRFTAAIRVPLIVKDTEVMPWTSERDAWLKKEVEKPFTITEEKKGYEIPFTREFYIYQPLRDLIEVTEEFAAMEKQNQSLLEDLGINLTHETV